jgi:hypothetical protein
MRQITYLILILHFGNVTPVRVTDQKAQGTLCLLLEYLYRSSIFLMNILFIIF